MIKYKISKEYNLKEFDQFLEFSKEVLYQKENKKVLTISMLINSVILFSFFALSLIFIFVLSFYIIEIFNSRIYRIIVFISFLSLLIYDYFLLSRCLLKYVKWIDMLGINSKANIIPINKYDLNYVIYCICRNINKKSINEYRNIFEIVLNESNYNWELVSRDWYKSLYKKYMGSLTIKNFTQIVEECFLVQNILSTLEYFSLDKTICELVETKKPKFSLCTRLSYTIGTSILIILIFTTIIIILIYAMRGVAWM